MIIPTLSVRIKHNKRCLRCKCNSSKSEPSVSPVELLFTDVTETCHWKVWYSAGYRVNATPTKTTAEGGESSPWWKLGPVDPRDDTYTTRLKTPSTDQSSRRPPHRKKCTRTAICFIGRHPRTGNTFTRGPCVFSNHIKGHLGSRRPLHVQPLTPTHQRLRLEWCHTRGNWTAAEWNQVVFSDGSKFNLSIEDNCVREWRPREFRNTSLSESIFLLCYDDKCDN
ncbi:UNVERIFIED_CONTAM: hypothetical protein NCL1_35241 [Trichonephila clavipes]